MTNNKFKKWLLIASLSLNVLFVLFFVLKRVYYANYDYFHPKPTIEERWANFLNSTNNGKEVVFLGTSITQGFNVTKEFNNPQIKNMGFSGNTTNAVLASLKRVVPRKPYKIFIEGGVNDFKYKIPLDTAVNNVLKMIEVVQVETPKTALYIQSEFPTNLKKLNDTIDAYNSRIKSICKLKGVNFIDFHDDFLRYGIIDNSLTLDGTHLNETGYFLWRRNIERFVN